MRVNSSPNMLRMYRHMHGLSMKRVSKLLGYKDSATLSRWERGHTLPPVKRLFELAQLYEALPHELLQELWKVAKGIKPKNRTADTVSGVY